ncbi:hypothetical protein AB0A95_13340 [Micromonospora sp. NPDC049230]|uniref:hypothetical protein n=1 Tax=Micromonospora sp. NPDC049230 TaxID=3155502 RepID=UPI0033DC7E04
MIFEEFQAGLASLSNRFVLTSLLPTVTGSLMILVLVLAESSSGHPDWAAAWQRITGANVVAIIAAALIAVVLALLLRPLHSTLARITAGHWPAAARAVTRARQRRHTRSRDRLAAAAADLPADPRAIGADGLVQRAGAAGAALRERYPRGEVLPTALGNAVTAAVERAGSVYGLDAAVAWPRLYPLLPADTRVIVDDRRAALDAATVTAVTMAFTTVAAAALLLRCDWWLLLVLVPAALGFAAYRGAVAAAVAYGHALDVAFDLHRFDLYRAMHLPAPATLGAETQLARQVCRQWRQGVADPGIEYHHLAAPGPGR